MNKIRPSWFLLFCSQWKTHHVSNKMLPALKRDAELRGHEVIQAVHTSTGAMDTSGPVIVGRPWCNFRITPGFDFSFPCEDLPIFFHRLGEEVKNIRKFENGTEYVKLHSHNHCLVLTPKQAEALLQQMRKRLTRAKKRNDAFMAKWDARHPMPEAVKVSVVNPE